MSTSQADIIVTLILKNALEFNAGITALASMYVGNCTSEKVATRFSLDYRKVAKDYEDRQKRLLDELLSPTAPDQ